MHNNIHALVHNLNLSEYQENKIKSHYDRYNISRLEKRGGLLYAPYVVHGFWGRVSRVLFGVRADLIAENKTLLQAQRNIKFCANGFHSVKVGKYTYYADARGENISKYDFNKNR